MSCCPDPPSSKRLVRLWDTSGLERYRPFIDAVLDQAQVRRSHLTRPDPIEVEPAPFLLLAPIPRSAPPCTDNSRQIVVLCYDVRSEASLQALLYWKNAVAAHCAEATLVLVGSHVDHVDAVRISVEDGERQAKEWSAVHHVVNSKSGLGVDAVLGSIASVVGEAKLFPGD